MPQIEEIHDDQESGKLEEIQKIQNKPEDQITHHDVAFMISKNQHQWLNANRETLGRLLDNPVLTALPKNLPEDWKNLHNVKQKLVFLRWTMAAHRCPPQSGSQNMDKPEIETQEESLAVLDEMFESKLKSHDEHKVVMIALLESLMSSGEGFQKWLGDGLEYVRIQAVREAILKRFLYTSGYIYQYSLTEDQIAKTLEAWGFFFFFTNEVMARHPYVKECIPFITSLIENPINQEFAEKLSASAEALPLGRYKPRPIDDWPCVLRSLSLHLGMHFVEGVKTKAIDPEPFKQALLSGERYAFFELLLPAQFNKLTGRYDNARIYYDFEKVLEALNIKPVDCQYPTYRASLMQEFNDKLAEKNGFSIPDVDQLSREQFPEIKHDLEFFIRRNVAIHPDNHGELLECIRGLLKAVPINQMLLVKTRVNAYRSYLRALMCSALTEQDREMLVADLRTNEAVEAMLWSLMLTEKPAELDRVLTEQDINQLSNNQKKALELSTVIMSLMYSAKRSDEPQHNLPAHFEKPAPPDGYNDINHFYEILCGSYVTTKKSYHDFLKGDLMEGCIQEDCLGLKNLRDTMFGGFLLSRNNSLDTKITDFSDQLKPRLVLLLENDKQLAQRLFDQVMLHGGCLLLNILMTNSKLTETRYNTRTMVESVIPLMRKQSLSPEAGQALLRHQDTLTAQQALMALMFIKKSDATQDLLAKARLRLTLALNPDEIANLKDALRFASDDHKGSLANALNAEAGNRYHQRLISELGIGRGLMSFVSSLFSRTSERREGPHEEAAPNNQLSLRDAH